MATRSRAASAGRTFDHQILVLQGGGALGAHHAGVYEGLAEARLAPNWVIGVSIGAIASALIAGNSPERRVERQAALAPGRTAARQGNPRRLPLRPARLLCHAHAVAEGLQGPDAGRRYAYFGPSPRPAGRVSPDFASRDDSNAPGHDGNPQPDRQDNAGRDSPRRSARGSSFPCA